jgi:hypothetical protein
MKMKSLILIIVSAVAITGCTTPSRNSEIDPRFAALKTYSTEYRPKAVAGEIAWSDYYNGAYQRALASNVPGEHLALINQMIWNSEQFEAGKISKEEFTYRQRDNSAQQLTLLQRMAAADRADQQARAALALQAMQSMQPLTMPTVSASAPMARPALPTMQPANPGVTAIWTGKQQQAQTITNQIGWSCEYNYAGRTFWRTFVGPCPSSVQVQ